MELKRRNRVTEMIYISRFPIDLRKLVVLCLLSFLFASPAVYGEVDLKVTYYNSDATVSEDISIENADYSGISVLLPGSGYTFGFPFSDSISSISKAKSNGESGKLSHEISATADGTSENIGAHLITEYGYFECAKKAASSSAGSSMKMSVNCGVDDGILEAVYTNTDSAIREETSTIKSRYSSKTIIDMGSIKSQGNGESQSSEGSGFSSHIELENLDKSVEMVSNLMEDAEVSEGVDHKWETTSVLGSESSSVKNSVGIMTRTGWYAIPTEVQGTDNMVTVGMVFDAYNLANQEPVIERQYLPHFAGVPLFLRLEKDDPGNAQSDTYMNMKARWSREQVTYDGA